MSEPLPEAQEELLRRVLLGELEATSLEVQKVCASSAGFHRELERTMELERMLDRVHSEERLAREEAAQLANAPGEERVGVILRRLVRCSRIAGLSATSTAPLIASVTTHAPM